MPRQARRGTVPTRPERRAARRAAPPATLAVDIGASGIKASVVDAAGEPLADRERVPTPHPCTPARLVRATLALARALPSFDRASVGFPGVVHSGVVYTAPNLGNEAFYHFDAAATFQQRLGVPVRVVNDADMHGLGVIRGEGIEVVLTLGSGVGAALFLDGRLGPHFDFVTLRKGEVADDLAAAGLERLGARKWSKRVERFIDSLRELTNFDHLYLGGGNADRLEIDLPHDVAIVSNHAALIGSIRVWDAEPTAQRADDGELTAR
ncbi:MAG: ROK family protein [Gemmatimonadaceae bacterium]